MKAKPELCGGCDYFCQCAWLRRQDCRGGWCWHLWCKADADDEPQDRCFTPIGGRPRRKGAKA